MSIKASRFYGIGLALLTVGSFAACSSDDTPLPGVGGTGVGTGGTSTAGTGTGGNPPAAGSSSGGKASGGTGAGGATGGSGGSGGASPTSCAGTKPASALITEFADLVPNATTPGQFSFTLGVPGGTFAYKAGDLTVSNTGMALNVKGTVKNYDGFGIYTTACMDASAYTGVSFSIKGNVGATGMLSFRVQTNANTAVDLVNHKGSCVVPATVTDPYEACHASSFAIAVGADAKTVSVKFSDLTDGIPVPAVTGKDILGLEWAFAWDPMAAPAAGGSGGGGGGGAGGGASGGTGGAAAGGYQVDVTVDDLKFTGGPSGGGTGGMGGAGGSGGAAGGTGGAAGGTGGAAGGSGGSGGNP